MKLAVDKYGLTMTEVALRWMTHHSQLGKKFSDAILIGASDLVVGDKKESRVGWEVNVYIKSNKGLLAEGGHAGKKSCLWGLPSRSQLASCCSKVLHKVIHISAVLRPDTSRPLHCLIEFEWPRLSIVLAVEA